MHCFVVLFFLGSTQLYATDHWTARRRRGADQRDDTTVTDSAASAVERRETPQTRRWGEAIRKAGLAGLAVTLVTFMMAKLLVVCSF